VGILAFWVTKMGAVSQAYWVATLFLSGQIAPLSLLPPVVQTLASLLPFRWMVSFPVELGLGRLTLEQTLTGFVAQAVWIGIALVVLRVSWRAGVRRYSAVGA
jgi:ABC-2 type transport system permease protein